MSIPLAAPGSFAVGPGVCLRINGARPYGGNHLGSFLPPNIRSEGGSGAVGEMPPPIAVGGGGRRSRGVLHKPLVDPDLYEVARRIDQDNVSSMPLGGPGPR